MAGTLYIVATPIGNLDDMPPRVAATFGAADFIAAEDTRVTMKLLNFLGLKKPMVSYYEHALQKGEGILRRIEAGEIRNVVPAHGFMQLEVRGATGEINDYVVNQALRLIKGAALGYDVEYAVTKAGEATSLLNDPELVDLVTEVASGVPGVETVSQDRSMGASEDFTMLGARVQAHGGKAAFFIIGADRPGAHHQKNFDFDENALGVGFSVFKGCLENLNGSVG